MSDVRGFGILSAGGLVAVSPTGNPSSNLGLPGTGSSTVPLAGGMTIVKDVGTSNPAGSVAQWEAAGLGSFSGTVTTGPP